MDAQQKLKALLGQLNTVIVGKPAQVRDCVACLLAGGHLLIEDVPGVGKTTLAHALAGRVGLVHLSSDLVRKRLAKQEDVHALLMEPYLSYNGGTWNLAQRFIAAPTGSSARC